MRRALEWSTHSNTTHPTQKRKITNHSWNIKEQFGIFEHVKGSGENSLEDLRERDEKPGEQRLKTERSYERITWIWTWVKITSPASKSFVLDFRFFAT